MKKDTYVKDDVIEFKHGKKTLRGKIMGPTDESLLEYFVITPHLGDREHPAFSILKLHLDEMTKVEADELD